MRAISQGIPEDAGSEGVQVFQCQRNQTDARRIGFEVDRRTAPEKLILLRSIFQNLNAVRQYLITIPNFQRHYHFAP